MSQPRMKLENKFPARWAIGRQVGAAWINLVERTPVTSEEEAATVLRALHIPGDRRMLDHYFPENAEGERCPTYELIELWYDLGGGGPTGASTSV